MRSNKLGVFFLLVVGAGCGSAPPPPQARIDFARVAALETRLEAPRVPALQRKTVSRTLSAPAIPPRTLAAGNNAERRQRVEDVVEAAREDARKDLLERLVEAYNAELKRKRQERLQQAGTVMEAAELAAYEATRRLFEEYARKRGPLVIRRNLLATHPDRRKRLRDPKLVAERDEQAKVIAAEIKRLDEEYETRSKEAFRRIQDEYAESLSKIQMEIEAERAELLARAEREAMAQAREELGDLPELTESGQPLALPGAPARTERVEMTVDPPAPSNLGATIQPNSMELARTDAEVWAALHGLTLSTDPKVPDRTDEFLEWRRNRLGP